MSKKLINLSNLQKFLLKLNEKFALKKAMKGITEDSEGNIIIGEEGLVPTPDENSKGKFLSSDGTWSVPGDSQLYESMSQEEGIEGVSEVDRVINAKTLKAVIEENENVVHKTGIETIGGKKKFIADIVRKYTDVDITTTPTSDMYARFSFADKNDTTAAYVQYGQRPSGVDYIGIRVRDKNSNTLGVQINTNKEFVSLGDDNSYSLGSASNKWAKVYSDDVVHTSGNESINGIKTFTASPIVSNNATTNGYSIKLNTIARNEVPTQLYHATFRAYDKNDKILGEYCVEKSTTGCTLLNMNVRSEDAEGKQLSESLCLNMSNDGSVVRFYPSSNNKVDLGMSNQKWANVYATTFNGNLKGNADTSTQFSANKSVTLTGDVTGSASSKGGWSVATTLANSGVTAGTYGPSANVTGNNNSTVSIPQITVDAKGRVTSVVNRTLTCKNNTYTVPTKVSQLTNDNKYVSLVALGSGDTNGIQETEVGSVMLCTCNCSVLENTSSSIQSNRSLQVPGSYLTPISWMETSEGNLVRTSPEGSSYNLSGTWRLLGNFMSTSNSAKIYYVGLFMRVV